MGQHNTIICLMGPTASGKTDIAIELLKHLPVDIISVDSAMVYRGMDIGTAKPEPAVLAAAPHRLINLCEPFETYSAAQFRQDALQEIEAILAAKRIPLLVGGTMMYFKALQQGLSILPAANPQIREELTLEAAQKGWQALHERLQAVDPISAAKIHPNDAQRLQRALEVYLITGQPVSILQQAAKQPLPYRVINLILAPGDKNLLKERIAARFRQMLTKGFIDEVINLRLDTRLTIAAPSMRAVGYRQIWQYLDGEISYQEMQEHGIIATQQLAKRQFTWLNAWENANWFDSLDSLLLNKLLRVLENV